MTEMGRNDLSLFSRSGTVMVNVWHHAAIVYSAANPPTVWLYLDGRVMGTSPVSPPVMKLAYANPLRLGCAMPGYFEFRGFIDELKIYDYPRSAEQIVRDAQRP
jgi:hypothetical protein